MKKGESIVSGKVLVTCTVTILGIGSHSGIGKEWADDDNSMTSADAQAFYERSDLGQNFADPYIRHRWLSDHSRSLRHPVNFCKNLE